MKKWLNKKPKKEINTKPKMGDIKIKLVFLWFPFLNDDGFYYWWGYVHMEYIYFSWPLPIYGGDEGWIKTKIIDFIK